MKGIHCRMTVLKIAKTNQMKQAKQAKPNPNPRERGKRVNNSRATTFAQKSKEAALKQSQQSKSGKRKLLYSSSSENKSFIKATPSKVQASSTMLTFNIRETPAGPTFKVTATSDANDFMNSPPNPTQNSRTE